MRRHVPSRPRVGLHGDGRRANAHAGRIVTGTVQNVPPGAREKRNRIMTRNILSLILLTTLAAAVSLNAEPTPSADRTSSSNANKVESQKPQAKTKTVPKIVPVPPSYFFVYQLRQRPQHGDNGGKKSRSEEKLNVRPLRSTGLVRMRLRRSSRSIRRDLARTLRQIADSESS